MTDGGELSIAKLVGTPHVVSFISRVTIIEGKHVQVRCTRHDDRLQVIFSHEHLVVKSSREWADCEETSDFLLITPPHVQKSALILFLNAAVCIAAEPAAALRRASRRVARGAAPMDAVADTLGH